MVFETNCLSFLPVSSRNKRWNFVDEIKKSFSSIKKFEDFEFQNEVVNLLLEKCEGEEPDCWTRDDYVLFQRTFRGVDPHEIDEMKQTIITLLRADKKEILDELNRISEMVDFYPSVERTYIAEEKRYHIQPKKIQFMDCFMIIASIRSFMYSFIFRQAEQISASGQDFETFYSTIVEIIQNNDLEEQKPFLEGFEQTFSYVRDSSLYKNLYENVQSQFFQILRHDLIRIKNSVERKKYVTRTIAYYDYKNDSLLNRDLINRSKSFRKFR